jgi:lipopolysaccharide/colanic/teichoic acid biosynthesis glycosyltransferase
MRNHKNFVPRMWWLRTLDVLASLGVLVVALPAMVLTFLAIRLEDGWRAPVLCTQKRVGLDGRTFNAIKFRSTRPDACGNPRITRVGAVIRQLGIDELPLLLNALHGEVSLIMKKDRSLRWGFLRDLAIIVGLVLLGIVIGTR